MAYKDSNDPRSKEAKLRHYYNNKEQYAERNKKNRESLIRFLNAVKSFPCTDCDVSYPPYVMQFDHVTGEKKHTPATLKTWGWKTAIAEIMKCELVCANCHAERTHNRL